MALPASTQHRQTDTMSTPHNTDNSASRHYREKREKFDNMLTIYGRKAVLEALQDQSLPIYRLHLAESNRPAAILQQITVLAQQRGIEIHHCDKRALSRISRNSKQDQGVAADLALPQYQQLAHFMEHYCAADNDRFIALDGVSNPQNLGMIIRSTAAAGVRGLIIPERGCAEIGPLTIKASAGSVFKCPIIRCQQLADALDALQQQGVCIATTAADGERNLLDLAAPHALPQATLFVLGNESEGISENARRRADFSVTINMENQVESLNVAVTAALIAFISKAGSASSTDS